MDVPAPPNGRGQGPRGAACACVCVGGGGSGFDQVDNGLFYLDSLDSTEWLAHVALPVGDGRGDAATDADGAPISASHHAADGADGAAELWMRRAPTRAVHTRAIFEDYERNMTRIARYAVAQGARSARAPTRAVSVVVFHA